LHACAERNEVPNVFLLTFWVKFTLSVFLVQIYESRPPFRLQVLNSDYLLKEPVREADVEWGRVQGERPYFEREGSPPHPDDPYTFESVRKTLAGFIEQLGAGDG
jgi:hypothetical protein